MTVYVDLLFGLNAVINYLLLRGSAAIGGCAPGKGRMPAAAAVGGLYAVAAVIWPSMQKSIPQLIGAAIMVVLAFGWRRTTVKQGLYFYALSFALSGAVLLLVELLEPDCMLLGGRAYYALSVPALLLIAGVGYALAALVLSGTGIHTGGDLIAMTVQLGENTVALNALRDTGNVLRDSVTGQAVLVAEGAVLQELLPKIELSCLKEPADALAMLNLQYPDLRFRLVPYRTVGVEAGLLLAVRCQCTWKGSKSKLLVAFTPTTVSEDGRFQAIWGGESG